MANKPKAETAARIKENQLINQAATDNALLHVQEEKKMKEEEKAKLMEFHQIGIKTGQLLAFKGFRLMASYLEGKQLTQIKNDEKILKSHGFTDFIQYLESIGYGKSTAYYNMQIADKFMPEDVQSLEKIGLTRKDLLGLASLPDEQRLQITEGKVINLDKADKEEIRSLIEDFVLENQKLKEDKEGEIKARDRRLKDKEESIQKLQKIVGKYEHAAEAKGLTLEEDSFLKKMEHLRKQFDGYYMMNVDPERIKELTEVNELSPRMVASYLTSLDYLRKQILAAYDTALTNFGNPVIAPEDAWHQPEINQEFSEDITIK